MRHLTLREILEIHERVIQQSGGAAGIRAVDALEAAVAQPHQTFAGKELYPTGIDKASALAFTLIQNHPFIDGNKRTGHAAMEIFLILNGYQLQATIDEQEHVMLAVAAGEMNREQFTAWLQEHATSADIE